MYHGESRPDDTDGRSGSGGRLGVNPNRPRCRLLRGLLRVAVLGVAAGGLLTALLIILPAPDELLRFAGVAATELSLIITVVGLLGLGLAALARRVGLRSIARVAAAALTATLLLSLLPLVSGLRTAADQDVSLSLADYLPRPGAEVPSETVTYRAAAGPAEPLRLDIWRPEASPGARPERRPAAVLVHGGGWDQGSRGGQPLAGWLAGRGYVVFDIDYRLATATDPSWHHATSDVKCAVGWVAAQAGRFGIDPARIGLLGWSAGGHLALLAAYARTEPALAAHCPGGDQPVAAVAALYPVTDLTALVATPVPWWDRSPDVRTLVSRFVGGTPATVPDRYRVASPISQVTRGVPPTFLAHGTRDQTVPIGQSRDLARRLAALGVPCRLIELPGSNHGYDLLAGGWNTQTTRSALDRFLSTWLRRVPQ